MSEKPTPEKFTPSDQELDQRLEDFTRRGLLRVGWVTPIVVSAALPAHAAPSHVDTNGHIDNYVDVPHEDEPHTDEPHDDHDDEVYDDEPHVDEPHEDEPACEGSGAYGCAGITFTASAVMTSWETQCSGSTQLSDCCDQGEAQTAVFEEPCTAELTLSHDHSGTLTVKVDYFTFAAVGCTNSSSFHEFTIPPSTEVSHDGDIQGDAPECTGFRIVEVKDAAGAELCKPDPCPEGDLGLYVVLEKNGDGCPDS